MYFINMEEPLDESVLIQPLESFPGDSCDELEVYEIYLLVKQSMVSSDSLIKAIWHDNAFTGWKPYYFALYE